MLHFCVALSLKFKMCKFACSGRLKESFLINFLRTGEFGGLKWSNNEARLMYVAERSVMNAEYFDGNLDWSNEEKIKESNVVLQ